MSVNQAVLFTKPVHHLDMELDPEGLDQYARDYFGSRGFSVVRSRKVTGSELSEREIIRKHYQMYSKASYGDIGITAEGMEVFHECFDRDWDTEVEGGRIMGNPQLLDSKGIDAHELFRLWNDTPFKKIQAGVLMGWLESLDCYCINAFYPAMEANFYHPDTRIDYYVMEFDPAEVSWMQFRKEILGATNAAKAAPESFRGRLYAQYRVDYPGRDNFIHGSAGPFEGLIERSIHEPDFDMADNPVGRHLAAQHVSAERLAQWKSRQTNAGLGELFDETEEKNTDEILPILDSVTW
jgi:hypothetical protein